MNAKIDDSCPNLDAHPATSPTSNDDIKRIKIRRLNDILRISGNGGRVMITDSLLAEGLEFAQETVKAIAEFDGFNCDNDPWGEHDCASLTVQGTDILWKIDYYDRQMVGLSPDPSDSKVTCRVLTIMLARDY